MVSYAGFTSWWTLDSTEKVCPFGRFRKQQTLSCKSGLAGPWMVSTHIGAACLRLSWTGHIRSKVKSCDKRKCSRDSLVCFIFDVRYNPAEMHHSLAKFEHALGLVQDWPAHLLSSLSFLFWIWQWMCAKSSLFAVNSCALVILGPCYCKDARRSVGGVAGNQPLTASHWVTQKGILLKECTRKRRIGTCRQKSRPTCISLVPFSLVPSIYSIYNIFQYCYYLLLMYSSIHVWKYSCICLSATSSMFIHHVTNLTPLGSVWHGFPAGPYVKQLQHFVWSSLCQYLSLDKRVWLVAIKVVCIWYKYSNCVCGSSISFYPAHMKWCYDLWPPLVL